jgi:hypothetical protein
MERKIVLGLYRFTLEAQDELRLPDYWGSTLRGAFGHAFRRLACPARPGEPCPIPQQCAYHLIFETSPPPDAPALRNLEEIPRPFVIAPPPPPGVHDEPCPGAVERTGPQEGSCPAGTPLRSAGGAAPRLRLLPRQASGADDGARETDLPGRGGRHPPGAELAFSLTLVGRAIDFLPWFIVAFRELGLTGIGRGRGRFRLRQIDAIEPFDQRSQPVYRDDDRMVRSAGARVSLAACRARAPSLNGRLTLRFLTPTRLKHDNRLVEHPEFHVLFRALLRRLSSLALFHCGVRLDVDYRGLIAAAETVRLVEDRSRRLDFERYSSRQRQRMDLGGLVGEAVYEGHLTPFVPYLLFGQWTHVGKNATFGLGRYRLL